MHVQVRFLNLCTVFAKDIYMCVCVYLIMYLGNVDKRDNVYDLYTRAVRACVRLILGTRKIE